MQLLVCMYVSMYVRLKKIKKSEKKSKNIYVDQYIFKQNLKKITSLYLLSTLENFRKKKKKKKILFPFE